MSIYSHTIELMNDLRKDILHQLEDMKRRSLERAAEHDETFYRTATALKSARASRESHQRRVDQIAAALGGSK
jgi:hypothetical protein